MTYVAIAACAVGFAAAWKMLWRHHPAACCSWGHPAPANRLAALGMAYYAALAATVLAAPAYAPALAATGFLASVGLTLAQMLDDRWCRWCLLSGLSATVAAVALVFG